MHFPRAHGAGYREAKLTDIVQPSFEPITHSTSIAVLWLSYLGPRVLYRTESSEATQASGVSDKARRVLVDVGYFINESSLKI
jgi:hypothetical protein